MAETLKLTNDQVQKVCEGLRGLDGANNEDGVFIPFKFKHETRWSIATNIEAFDRANAVFDRAKKMSMKAHKIVAGQQINEKNVEAVGAYTDELDDLKQKKVEVFGVIKLTRKELENESDGKRNEILPSVIAKLFPIISTPSSS